MTLFAVLAGAVLAQTGAVSSGTVTLRDGARDKDLEIRCTWPVAEGRYPVIVFSHGLGGSAKGYGPVAEYWASHGYVIVQPTHEDSFKNMSAEQKRNFLTRSKRETGDSRQRPKDVSFCLDSLGELESRLPGLKGKCDVSRIGMGGHSYGAWTTMVVGGTQLIAGRFSTSMSDERPKALLLLSPQGLGGGFTEESYKTMTRPTMTVSGTEDTDPFAKEKPAEWRQDPYKFQPPKDKWLVWIESADHALGGVSGADGVMGFKQDDKVREAVLVSSLAFWDTYVKGSGSMKRVNSGELTKVVGKQVTVSTK